MNKPVLFDINWNACINCGACVAVCPQEKPFISPFDTIAVDRPCDIACMVCEMICPVTTITHRPAVAADYPNGEVTEAFREGIKKEN